MTEKQKALWDIFTKQLDDETLLRIWCDYCHKTSNREDWIYPIDFLNEDLRGWMPIEIVEVSEDCHFADNYYCWYNGDIYSCYTIKECLVFDIDCLVSYILRNNDSFGISEIENVLNSD